LDGTLVDTLAVCCLAFRGAVERVGGRSLSDAEIYALFGPSEDGMMQRVFPTGWEPALEIYFAEYERLLPRCPAVIADVASALELLRRGGIPVGLVTGKSRVTTEQSLRHFRLERVFDAIETGSPTGVVKADAIRRILGRWRVEPADVIYVGDARADMLAAREAGVIAVGAAWASGIQLAELTASRPDVIFSDAGVFLAWLRSRAPAPP
jgi:phosphoglycolate phosphatase-like HAD superfamily hydrolase